MTARASRHDETRPAQDPPAVTPHGAALVPGALGLPLSPAQTAPDAPRVTVVLLTAEGRAGAPRQVAAVRRSEAQWQAGLTAEQYRILQAHGTERAFCGLLLDNKEAGLYACVGCALPLFDSSAKFESGTGWPSYFAPFAPQNVLEQVDRAYGMLRTEILCARCEGHLGHVFPDGPPPTGLRYCLNSEALVFVPATELGMRPEGAHLSATAWFAAGTSPKAETWPERAALAGLLSAVPGVTAVTPGSASARAEDEAPASGAPALRPALRVEYDPQRLSYLDLCERLLSHATDGAAQPLVLLAAGTEQRRLAEALLAAQGGPARLARLAEFVPQDAAPAR